MVDDKWNGTTDVATMSLLDSGEALGGAGDKVGGPESAEGGEYAAGAHDVGGIGQASTIRAEAEDAEYDIQKKLEKGKIKERLFQRPPAPMRIGRFIVLEKLGAGAMGEVYSAYDEQLDRKVALKLVRPELAAKSQKASQRLIREAQTQARLSHTNVVQVYEAGMFKGRVFLAMEFIRGQNLREWLDELDQESELSASARWRLVREKFIDAGEGLKAAHSAGLVHRDFKPGNVLVGDGDGRVCVADFGLARKVETELGADGESAEIDPRDEVTLDPDEPPRRGARAGRQLAMRTRSDFATAHGAIVGTPAYMSPEQFEGRTADARSDQYSFCVALYEALYGRRPYDGDSFADLKANVLRGELPAPPRVSPVPARIWKAIARGLARDPGERFPSMEGLLDVLSGAGNRRLRLGIGIGAAGAIIAAAAAVAVAVVDKPEVSCEHAGDSTRALWSDVEREGMRAAFAASGLPYQQALFEHAEQRIDGYVQALALERVHTCEATHVRGEQSQELFTLTTLCIDRFEHQLTTTLRRLTAADKLMVEKSGQIVAALPPVSACRDRETLSMGVEIPADPTLREPVEKIREQLDDAYILWLSGYLERASAIVEVQWVKAREANYPPLDAEILYHRARLQAHGSSEGSVDEAEATYLEAVDLAESHRYDQMAGDIWLELADLATRRRRDYKLAHLFARRALAASERSGYREEQRAQALRQRGVIYAFELEYATAERYHRRALDAISGVSTGRIIAALAWHDLGFALTKQSRVDEAREAYEHAIRLYKNELGPSTLYLARGNHDFGILELEAGNFDRARELLSAARTMFVDAYGATHEKVAMVAEDLANVELQAGRLKEAEQLVAGARVTYETVLPDDVLKLAKLDILIAIIQFKRGLFEDAASSFERALVVQRTALGEDHILVAETLSNLGETLVEVGRCDDALVHLKRAGEIFRSDPDKMPLLDIWIKRGLGLAHLCVGNALSAKQLLTEVQMVLRSHQGDPFQRAGVLWALARARRESGDWPNVETRALAQEALELFESAGASGSGEIAEIRAWLESRGTNP